MSTPAYDLHIEHKEGYIQATVTGENSPEVVRAYLSQLRAAMVEYDCVNLLIVEYLEGDPLDPISVFRVASKATAGIAGQPHKIAFVDPDETHRNSTQFAETVARNRGANVRMFWNVEEARRWLMT